MIYLTQGQLVDQFGEDELISLTDRGRVGVINSAIVDAAITQAGKRIEGYIQPRYTLPLSQAMIDGSSLPEMAGYIVRYILYNDLATDRVRDDYKDALNWLRDIQSGKSSLGVQDAQMTQNEAEFSSSAAVFGRNSRGFI